MTQATEIHYDPDPVNAVIAEDAEFVRSFYERPEQEMDLDRVTLGPRSSTPEARGLVCELSAPATPHALGAPLGGVRAGHVGQQLGDAEHGGEQTELARGDAQLCGAWIPHPPTPTPTPG